MLHFTKFQGSGNDFILVEDFEENFPLKTIPFLCNRHFGIGADGLILARSSLVADFQMVYFNADGSHPGLCGNGLRCFTHFLQEKGYKQKEYKIQVAENILTVKCEEDKIFTLLPKPVVLFWELSLKNHTAYVVKTGVPHIVIFPPSEVDVAKEGRELRHHPQFNPEGANVNFVWKQPEGFLKIRTYERGVEKETFSCATGAVAAAFVAHSLGLVEKIVKILPMSEEIFEVRLDQSIQVLGPSKKVFEGQIKL